MGMIWHTLCGHDISKICFSQDDSGNTSNVEFVDEAVRQIKADDAVDKLKI
jgi:hypothetical protein